MSTQFLQQPEVAPHIILYLLKHIAPRVEVSPLKKKVEAQDKTLSQMDNMCREFRSRVDSPTKKENLIGKK